MRSYDWVAEATFLRKIKKFRRLENILKMKTNSI